MGYSEESKKLLHSQNGSKVFDARHPIKNKYYFQCVLAQTELFSSGAAAFSSGLPQSFYKLLLKNPRKAKAGLKASEYKTLLDQADGVPLALAAVAAQPIPAGVAAPLAIVPAGIVFP